MPLIMMMHQFIYMIMNLRIPEEDNDVLPFLLLIQQCIDILCNVRLTSPLSVPVRLRPLDFDSQLIWEGRDVVVLEG